jgi:hypothetical protein
VGSAAVPVASSFIGGPVGGILGTIAGTLLGSIAGPESVSVNRTDGHGLVGVSPGAAERAVLAESALQTVLAINEGPELDAIVQHMTSNWNANAPDLDAVASCVAPGLLACALDITAAKLNKTTLSGGSEATAAFSTPLPRRPLSGLGGQEAVSISGEGRDFIEGLLGPTRPISGEEGIFDFLGPVLKQAVSFGVPIVSQFAKDAVSGLVPKLLAKIGGGGTESATAAMQPHMDTAKFLFKRAAVADAALQALMSLPRSTLERVQLQSSSQGSQEEGIFDFIKTTVQKIGPFALDTVKNAANKLAPVLIDTAVQKFSDHLGLPSGGVAGGSNKQPLRTKVSFQTLLLGSAGNDNQLKVSQIIALGNTTHDLNSEVQERAKTWKPSLHRRTSWDSDDDGLIEAPYTP